METTRKAIAYVKDNVRKYEVLDAFYRAYDTHTSLADVNPRLANDIYDLMEEYGQDNDLPKGYWLEEYDGEEDVFFELVDIFSENL